MKAHRWRVYLNPLDDLGVYTGYQDVTDDVDMSSLGSIDQSLDNTDYNIGIYRNANVSLTLRNDSGRYSDVGQLESIFRFARSNSLVKITWQPNSDGLKCGFFKAGNAILAPEITVFVGLLSDKDAKMDIKSQKLPFTVLGRETLLSSTTTPFASINVGDLISTVIYTCLNQSSITALLTVDAGNINVDQDVVVDDVADLENITVWDALQTLLLISNSVLYIQNDAIIVAPRTVGVALSYTFYGQFSNNGPENIQDIQGVQNGVARTFNYLYWTPLGAQVQNSSSIRKYGATTREFNQTLITNTTNQAAILTAILNEFGLPKQEFDLYTPINYETIGLSLLNKISVDFPPMYLAGPHPIPVCGSDECNYIYMPRAIWSFVEDPTNYYKIEATSIDPQTELMCVSLRRV